VSARGGTRRWATASDLAATLDLEVLDTDLYRGVNTVSAAERTALYGGQVCAQALMAAGLTVAPDRRPHSLHGYFLRPGQADRPVLLHVDRDRDGGSFSARHVSAKQDGRVIFSMLASFHQEEPGGVLDRVPSRPVPPPDEAHAREFDSLLEMREVRWSEPPPGQVYVPDAIWVRARGAVGDDRLVQACALAYVSDLGSGFGQVEHPGIARGGPSIDHAVWFHAPMRADDWLLLELWPDKAAGARGVYSGSIRDRSGTLGAQLVQEMLLRLPERGGIPGAAPTVPSGPGSPA
jgi:acyl-CoA thioesterase-2